MNDMEYRAAAHPHRMCIDQGISAEAYRTYGVMDWLKCNRIAPEPKIVADILHVSKRSVERWVGELETAHWLRWNRNATDPWQRYELCLSADDQEIILLKIRALFASGNASVEAIDHILRSDRIVASDRAVASDNPVASDTAIITGDSPVAGNDPTIISDSDAAQQDALNGDSASHVGVGVSSYKKKDSPTTTISRKRATPLTLTVTEIWMRAQGVSKKKACQFADFDPHATAYEWEIEIPRKGSVSEDERQKRIGGLLDRWEVRPPALPPPPVTRAQGDVEAQQRNAAYRDAHWHAQKLLGPGAPWQQMGIVVEALVGGANDRDALAALAAEEKP